MENYNNGESIDINQIPEDKLVDLFRNFSEGCKSLEKLLRSLYAFGIQTIGCCGGYYQKSEKTGDKRQDHLNKYYGKPYISMKYNSEDYDEIKNMINNALRIKGVRIALGHNENQDTIGFYYNSTLKSNKFFEAIRDGLYMKEKQKKEFPEVGLALDIFPLLCADKNFEDLDKHIGIERGTNGIVCEIGNDYYPITIIKGKYRVEELKKIKESLTQFRQTEGKEDRKVADFRKSKMVERLDVEPIQLNLENPKKPQEGR